MFCDILWQSGETKQMTRQDSIFDASPTIDATQQGSLDDPFDLFSASNDIDGEPVYSTIDKSKKRISAGDLPVLSEGDAWDSLA